MLILFLALIGVKLLLVSGQSVYLYQAGDAVLDDTLMLQSAMSFAQGNWLGEYGFLTLSKYMFFPVWLGTMHILGIPYLTAGALLWAAVSAFAVASFAPVIKNNTWRLIFFAIMLFNPAISAAKVQLRVYRDNIFPALCTLCVVGFIGAALRKNGKISSYIGYLIMGGVGLALSWVTREDGMWILSFAFAASIICLIYIIIDKSITQKLVRSLALLVPYTIVAGVILAFCTMNYNYYGRFVLSDFTSKEFKAAYGAMTRVKHENWQPKVAVPQDVRYKLYENVEELAVLKPIMENSDYYDRFGNGKDQEFSTGGFYWALRKAAAQAGYYKDANTAKQYFETVAQKVNALCDSGVLPSIGKRVSTTSPIKAEYIAPTLAQSVVNMGRVLTFNEAEPYYDVLTLGQAGDIVEMETFLKEKSNSSAIPYTADPYYTPSQNIIHKILEILRIIYAIILPIAFVFGVIYLAFAAVKFFKEKKGDGILLLILFGLLLTAFLRCAMIAFMFVSSFNDGVEKIMYLSSVHPLLLMFAFACVHQIYMLFVELKEKKLG